MKSKTRIAGFWVVLIMISSCAMEEDFYAENSTDPILLENKAGNPVKIPSRSNTELIIGFKNDVSETYKKNLRKKYNVLSFERCDCTNNRIEKWTFADDVNIEERLGEIVQEGGVEGVDFQFYYANENTSPALAIGAQDSLALISRIKAVNGKVTVAVLDTGLDIGKIEGTDPFLHRETTPNPACPSGSKEIVGWDFANDDNDVYDDNGHGSIVTSILKSHLDASSITDYQVLPVKVFDANGTGSTFDILCGYLFATEKPEVKMVNMSFGWYKYPSKLLGRFMQQNPDVLHLASAGNSGVDTDQLKHFPSGYPIPNIISIGSFVSVDQGGQEITEISAFSNFGVSTIDFLSVGENIFFVDPSEKVSYPIEGTSFATPLVTAQATMYFIDGHHSPSNILNKIRFNATVHSSTNSFPVKYGNIVVE